MATDGSKVVPEDCKTPVTIITGFLGAGKTSLVNHILRSKATRRVAVVENEFGEVNIDKSLVSENLLAQEDLVSMENGCVCCSLRSDIVNALAELDRRSEAKGQRFDAVLLETTGLADPAPVAFTFFANPWIASKYKLDSILCLVDAQHIASHLEEAKPSTVDEAVNQIAFADTILLNKIDLVTEKDLNRAKELVRQINVTADVIDCQLDGSNPALAPDWSQLLGINSFSIERALQVDPTFMDSDSEDEEMDERTEALLKADNLCRKRKRSTEDEEDQMEGTSTAHQEEQIDSQDDHTMHERQPKRRKKRLHDLSGVGSVGITARGPLDQYRFNMFMRDLLAEKARDIMRSKGVLCVHGQEKTKFVFQGVHETICFGPAAEGWGEGEAPLNQMVFIGRNLHRRDLVEGFRSCVWVPLPDGWCEHFDPKTGQPYYVNPQTGRKQWERPEYACAVVSSSMATAGQRQHQHQHQNQHRKPTEVT